MEMLDPEEKGQLQLERLQSTLNRAYKNVPFHQNRFQERGLEPAAVETLSDLARLPFMERKYLGQNYPYGLFAVPLRDIVRIHTAPGTAFNPTVSGYTQQDLLAWREMVARALTAAGVGPNDILQISLDPGLSNWGKDYQDGAESIGAGVIPHTPLSSEKQVLVLRDYRTSVLVATPSSAARLLHYLFRSDVNPTGLNLKTLILVGEPVSPEFRRKLEDRFHAVTWLHYGLSEVPGPAVAFECRKHEGIHINEDHFIAEVIEPETGRALPEGEAGELILTSLTLRAFPLIRFRTGDRVRFIDTPCGCGLPLRRMEWLPGRTDDLLILSGVKVGRDQILRHIERFLGFLPAGCRFHIGDPHSQSPLEVWIPLEDRLFSDEIKMLERLMRDLEARLLEEIGVPVLVRLKEKRTLLSARIDGARKASEFTV